MVSPSSLSLPSARSVGLNPVRGLEESPFPSPLGSPRSRKRQSAFCGKNTLHWAPTKVRVLELASGTET